MFEAFFKKLALEAYYLAEITQKGNDTVWENVYDFLILVFNSNIVTSHMIYNLKP